jgi:hypothetical protein
MTQSTWAGPAQCDASTTSDVFDACPGCPGTCTFGHCEKFDLECIANGLTDDDKKAQALVMYSEKGTCQCLNTADCPETVYGCRCPVGLARVCKECNASALTGVCDKSPFNICSRDRDCAVGLCRALAPMYCPKVSLIYCSCMLHFCLVRHWHAKHKARACNARTHTHTHTHTHTNTQTHTRKHTNTHVLGPSYITGA